ncbi:hypothetical protein PENTCL1PPCAC_8702, partial [Pristionchus entomophagus]
QHLQLHRQVPPIRGLAQRLLRNFNDYYDLALNNDFYNNKKHIAKRRSALGYKLQFLLQLVVRDARFLCRFLMRDCNPS